MRVKMGQLLWLVVFVVVIGSSIGISVKNKLEETKILNETQSEVTKLMPVEDPGSNLTVDPDVAAIREFLDDLLTGGTESDETTTSEGRTFGFKRLQFMLLPMMYKMGVMTTMLAVITVISLKGLLIGVILLVLKLSSFLAKFQTAWQPQVDHSHGWANPPQPVHVHVHNGGGQHYAHHDPHSQVYNGWEPPSGPYGGGGSSDEHYYYKG